MINIEEERNAFEIEWIKLGGDFKSFSIIDNMYVLIPSIASADDVIKELAERAVNSAFALWLIQSRQKQVVIDDLNIQLKDAKATPEGFVLDAPARVGGGVFREGVKWKTVIESAQCLYEHSKDEIKPIVSPSDLLKIASGELVLVPRKATKKMIERGYEAHDCFFTLGSVRNVWDAMIEAQEQSHD